MQGYLYVIAAPSGAGKTSLVDALVQQMTGLHVSVSHTTRECRRMEVNGKNYFFVDEKVFQGMVEKGEFLEYATVFNCSYGTSHVWVNEQLSRGIDVVLEIDWQGARQVKEKFPDAVLIFILPPSLTLLHQRLQVRAQDSEKTIKQRMERAQQEIRHYTEFDYLVLNDDFSEALHDLMAIVRSQRLLYDIQVHKQAQLLSDLLKTGYDEK